MATHSVEYTAGGRVFQGVIFSEPSLSRPQPGVIVMHGGAGAGEHEFERARMLVELGYVAFVPDLFAETFASRAHGMTVIRGLVTEPGVLRERVNACLRRLRTEPGVDAERTAAIGFCFGGVAALELARSGADIGAVVCFHGGLHAPVKARPKEIACKVLVCTGSADPFITREHRAAFEDEMTSAEADWQMLICSGAQHGFTELAKDGPTRPGCAYHELADRMSWSAMRALFEEAIAPAVVAKK